MNAHPFSPFNTSTIAFGFYAGAFTDLGLAKHVGDPEAQKLLKRRNFHWNVNIVMSYIPFVGIIAGIFQRMTRDNPILKGEDWDGFRNNLTIRSWVATLGLGILFLIPDLIFTIGRHIESKKELNFSPLPMDL